jgi:hypothetical protein
MATHISQVQQQLFVQQAVFSSFWLQNIGATSSVEMKRNR